jgi:hypothetical protein
MTIPAELLKSTPRSVVLTGAGKATAFLAALFAFGALIGGGWIYVQADRSALRHTRHITDAISTPGEILTAKKKTGKDARWVMTYSFTAGGHVRTGSMTDRRPMPVGSDVTVNYLPSDPGDNWAAGHEPAGPPFWLAPVVGASCLAASGLIVLSIRRQIDLLTDGRPAVARVIGSSRRYRENLLRPHGRRVQVVRYEFRLSNGSLIQGRLDNGGRALAPDTEFIIVYDPDHPGRKTRYPTPVLKIL